MSEDVSKSILSGATESSYYQDSGSSSDNSDGFSGGLGIAIGLGIAVFILAIVFILTIKKSNPEFVGHIGYLISKNVVGSSKTLLNFMPAIFMLLGPLMDLINFEFQASKITIASLVVLPGQIILGLILKGFQNLLGLSGSLDMPIDGLIPNFIDSCRVNAFGLSFNSLSTGGVSNYTTVMLFIALSYMISLALISIKNPSASFPNWWVGPTVMTAIAIITSAIRLFTTPSCDTGSSFAYGIGYALMWIAIYFGVGLVSGAVVPFNNKINPQSSGSGGLLSGAVKPNTTQSCASPQGEGVVYEIYQDGEMVGRV